MKAPLYLSLSKHKRESIKQDVKDLLAMAGACFLFLMAIRVFLTIIGK